MNKASKIDNASLLSLFMFTVQEYDAITACVPLPTKIECSSISDPLGLRGSKIEDIEMVLTAICVRMMLQRKYFSNSERVQLKKLFDIAETDSRFNTKAVGDLRKRLKQPLGRDIELMLQDGNDVQGHFSNIEDIVYGSLLHADYDRAMRLQADSQPCKIACPCTICNFTRANHFQVQRFMHFGGSAYACKN